MAYGNAAKEAVYITRLIVLRRLSKGQEAQCEALRREAGRCWSDRVTMHKAGREQGQWISVREMEQRDILHQASRNVVTYCHEERIGRIFVGDVRDVQDGIHHGANNQKIAQWPHGQFYDYLSDKARRIGIHVAYIAEDGSTITCSTCGQRQMSALRRRTARCTAYGTLRHRDANGAANICSRGCYGRYGLVGVEHITHYRPVAAGQAEGCLLSASQISAKQL